MTSPKHRGAISARHIAASVIIALALLSNAAYAHLGKRCHEDFPSTLDETALGGKIGGQAALVPGDRASQTTLVINQNRPKDRSWGRIQNPKPGDRVWIDVSPDRGKNWWQCGPFEVGKDAHRSIVPAPTPPNLAYVTKKASLDSDKKNTCTRVCGDRVDKKTGNRKYRCSDWYPDNKETKCLN
jgi:hypothetical protein